MNRLAAVTARLAAGTVLLALFAAPAHAAHRIVVPVSGGSSTFLAASSDGSAVLFGTNQALVPEDLDDTSDIYRREGGRLTLVSGGEGGFGEPEPAQFVTATPTLSHVVWQSNEPVLSSDSDMGQPDLWVTTADGETRQVTVQSPFPSFGSVNPVLFARISADGAHIVFQTNEALAGFSDSDGGADDVYENFNGTIRLLSPNSSTGVSLRGISTDGNRVLMSTAASMLAADGETKVDIYERVNGTTTNLLTPGTAQDVTYAGASADALHVYFTTAESLNAVLDTDARRDVYERFNGATTLISTSATAGNGDFDASFQRASADGSRVFFTTLEGLDPQDTDGAGGDPLDDIYLREAGVTTLVTAGETLDSEPLVFGEITPDGLNVFFWSHQSFAGDTDGGFADAWRWNEGTMTRISVGEINDQGEFDSYYAGRSADLSSLIFQSLGQLTPADTDVFEDLYERAGTTTTLLTPALEPCTLLPSSRCAPRYKGASETGDRIWFESDERLSPYDAESGDTDVYESRIVGTPELQTTPEVNAYVEGDPAPVDPGISLTEATDDIFGATVRITSGFEATDVLAFQDTDGITGTLNPAGDTLTLTGRGTAADFQAALASVTYTTTSETPSGDTRVVEFTVTNGGHTDSATRSLTVTAANDAPVLVLGTGATDYTEGAGAVPIAPEIAVTDADTATLAGATIRIADGFVAGEDVLAFTPAGGITGTLTGDTLTLSGTATLAQYQAALRSVTYENVAETPTEQTRTFEFVVDDGDRTSAAATHAFGVFQRSIDVTNAVLAYQENSPAVAVDPGVEITDPDLETVQGATVQITQGYVAGEDVLGFADQPGITGTFNAAGDTLTLTGEATRADYVAALRSVTYRNLSDAPTDANRIVTFTVTGGIGSDARTIDVVAVDDAPVMTAGAAGAGFTENGLPAPVAPSISVADVDSPITGAQVRIETGFAAGDELTTTEKLPDGILSAWSPATGTFTLTGTAAPSVYTETLRTVAFRTDSEAPSTVTRSVSFVTTSGTGAASEPVTRPVTITAVNDAPVVNMSGNPLTYVPGDDPVPIDGGLGLEDPDSGLAGATVKLVGGQVEGEDVLSAEDRDDGITITIDAAEQTVTLAGAASVTAYRTALRDIHYANRSSAATGERIVQVQVTDPFDVSNVDTRTIVLGTRAPEAQTAPAVTGVARVGARLTAFAGDWSGSEPMTLAVHWQRCAENGTGCAAIPGATGSTYAPIADDVGSKLRVRVVADNADGTTEAFSALTAVVRAALAAPVIVAGPQPLVANDSATVRVSGEDGATFSCALDGAAFAECAPSIALADLADGEHVLHVRQHRDGLTSPAAERRWTVDTRAPGAPQLLAGPDATTASRSASIGFAGLPGERFECALDGADYAPCVSPVAYSDLELGAHTVLVRAVDPAGNAGAALRVRWTVAASADPGAAARLTLRAPRRIARRARSFQTGCALDGGVLARCEVIARIRRGSHLVRIGRGRLAPGVTGSQGTVRVRLSRTGRRLLRRAGRGTRIRLTGFARANGSARRFVDVATLRTR